MQANQWGENPSIQHIALFHKNRTLSSTVSPQWLYSSYCIVYVLCSPISYNTPLKVVCHRFLLYNSTNKTFCKTSWFWDAKRKWAVKQDLNCQMKEDHNVNKILVKLQRTGLTASDKSNSSPLVHRTSSLRAPATSNTPQYLSLLWF